jgi:hypothetical protein
MIQDVAQTPMLPVSITEGGVLPREIKAIPFRKHDLDNTVGDATKCDLSKIVIPTVLF